ncbi:MAG TPA: PIG-L deacetylase family protein [Thermomicrobiales bacterium]|nr:PIG-L deacetylase family protein [Thermomicrobiales bacterium]
MAEFAPVPATPNRVLVVQAHPDDTEFTSGGTMTRWVRAGAEVTYLTLTKGNRGSKDAEMTPERLFEIRVVEQRAACDVLGVKDVIYLDHEDGMLVADIDLRREVARVIRQVRPDTLMGFDPSARILGNAYLNHPDHIAAGDALIWGAFPAAGNRMYFPELLEEGLEPHTAHHLYLYATEQANAWIDITDTIDTKIEALRAHESQLGDWDPEEEMRAWARRDATANPNRASAGEYAESFRYIRQD